MFKCLIVLYGLPRELSGRPEVEVELVEGAGLPEIVAVLRRAIPQLEGRVVRTGKDQLASYYTFNINGRFCSDDKKIRIKSGDKIALLPLVSGG